MNNNYLLHGESARRLYFECVSDLPVTLLYVGTPNTRSYNNISEAILSSDLLALMKKAGSVKKILNGEASDYEKFRELCKILPKAIGNPQYILAHAFLKKHFDCELDINEVNCDEIWQICNEKITLEGISEASLIYGSADRILPCFRFEIGNNKSITDLQSLEGELSRQLDEAQKMGCETVIEPSVENFLIPNPYKADLILKKLLAREDVSREEYSLLDAQVKRIIAAECKKREMTLIFEGCADNSKMLGYLDKSGLLPRTANMLCFDASEDPALLEARILSCARSGVLGSVICTVADDGVFLPVKRDYFARALCNALGEIADRGEFTSDFDTLKSLVSDVLHNNLP